MPPTLPQGARYLPLPQILPTGGSGTIADISGNFWFSALKPTTAMAPAGTKVRQFQYAPGANVNWTPGSETTGTSGFWVLREVADSWDLLRIIIETVKDRLCALDFEYRLQPEDDESKNDLKARTKADPRVAALTNFFRYPDGHHTFRDWLRMIWEDILVLDAGAIYLERDLKGRIASLRPIDGGTISRKITDQGFTPPYPDIAYQQILYGLPAIDMTVADLEYVVRNPRTWKQYGFSPVEQMLVTIGIGLRKQDYDMKHWTEGNIPEALCFLPPDLPIDKVQEIQGWYDSILAGNNAMRRRLTFLPGYGSSKDQAFRPNILFPKDASANMKTPWDEWQMQLCCYALGTTPGQLMKMMNRATANQSAETAEEEGLEPKIKTTEAFLNHIIQSERGFGFADIEASCVQRRETDAEKQMSIDTGYVKSAILTVNECRVDMGKDPYDSSEYPEADEPGIMTQMGFIPLKQLPGGSLPDVGAGAGTAGGTTGAAPKPASGKKLKPVKKTLLLDSGVEGASLLRHTGKLEITPAHLTPEIAEAQAQIYDVTSKVFRRQRERATQAATEMLKKKKLSAIKSMKNFEVTNPSLEAEVAEFLAKFDPYHDASGKFSSGSGLEPEQSTEDKFKGADGKWDPERVKLHDQLMKEVIGDRQPAIGRAPIATIMGGGVAVGKSSIRGDVVPAGSDPVITDPDAIKAKLPEYAALKQEDPDNAATRVHEESSYINKRNIAEAIKRRLDINYDGSFSNSVSSDSLIKALHKEGYTVNVAYADVPTAVALERATVRAQTSTNPADAGRFVPIHDKIVKGQLIEGAATRHRLAAANFFRLQSRTDDTAPDSLKAYDTSGPFGSKPKLFYSKVGGKESIYDAGRLEQFRKKSQGIED